MEILENGDQQTKASSFFAAYLEMSTNSVLAIKSLGFCCFESIFFLHFFKNCYQRTCGIYLFQLQVGYILGCEMQQDPRHNSSGLLLRRTVDRNQSLSSSLHHVKASPSIEKINNQIKKQMITKFVT